jgi:hypothetical protein
MENYGIEKIARINGTDSVFQGINSTNIASMK